MVLGVLKEGIDAALHPSKGTKQKMTVLDALAFYYKFSLIPLILLVVVSLIVVNILPQAATQLSQLGPSGGIFIAVALVFYLWLAIPIGLLVESLLYHIIGKVLGFFKGTYSDTFTAVVFSALPVIGLVWLIFIPLLGSVIVFVASIWSIYVISVAFSNQHKTTVLNGFLVWLVLFIVAIILVALVASALQSALGTLPQAA